jgi:hypothetical protein
MSANLPVEESKQVDPTQTYFNNLGNENLRVSPEIDDAVVSYFENITGDKVTARNLAGVILQTAKNRGLGLAEVIDEFRKRPSGELNAYLAMFLNLDRIPTSLVGIGHTPQKSTYVTRAILP